MVAHIRAIEKLPMTGVTQVAPPTKEAVVHNVQVPRSRPGHPPRRRVADALAALAGLGLGVTLGLVITGENAVPSQPRVVGLSLGAAWLASPGRTSCW